MLRADGADCRTAQAQRKRQFRQVVAHERDIGRLERGVAADGAHHDADIGGRQRRRVVDAVADHRHAAPPGAHGLDGFDLVVRQQLGTHGVHAHVARHARGGADPVARQHFDPRDAAFPEQVDHVARRLARRVGQRDVADQPPLAGHQRRRGALSRASCSG